MLNQENNEKDYENPLGQADGEMEEEPLLTPEEEAAARTKSTAKELFEWVELFAYSVSIVIILFTFLCRIAVVSGPSMEKTLFDKEVLLVSDLFYEPKQGDVIVFQSNTILDNEAIVKRVIATEGQTVDINFDTHEVFVDGALLEENYINEPTAFNWDGELGLDYPAVVPEGHIFVLGDNRNNSSDSRFAPVGMISERCVLGKAIAIVLPGQTRDAFGNIISPREWSRIGLVK